MDKILELSQKKYITNGNSHIIDNIPILAAMPYYSYRLMRFFGIERKGTSKIKLNNKTLLFLMCKHESEYSRKITSYLNRVGIDCICIIDFTTGYKIKDKEIEKEGFKNLNYVSHVKSPGAWEKSFHLLYLESYKFRTYDYFYFMEDDVFTSNPGTLVEMIISADDIKADLISNKVRSKKNDPKWFHWKNLDTSQFKIELHSFNPLCRISNRLIHEILEYRKTRKSFMFHEVLFPSIAAQKNFRIMDWKKSPRLSCYFGNFDFRTGFSRYEILSGKILHPLKPLH